MSVTIVHGKTGRSLTGKVRDEAHAWNTANRALGMAWVSAVIVRYDTGATATLRK